MRTYRIVTKTTIGGLGNVRFYSDSFRLHKTPQQFYDRVAQSIPNVVMIEEFVGGQWVIV